jgi:hypothetical protein
MESATTGALMRAAAVLVAAVLVAAFVTLAFGADVFVNAQRVEEATLRQLERAYRVPIQPGRYWYDRVSGVWGIEGGPGAGQIMPGLALGGPLAANASNGSTRVFVNGRELHRLDVAALQRCTPVIPGRYWVMADGVGGPEGGPATFNLAALCAPRGGGGSSMRCENYGNGQFNCSNPVTGGGMISEGGGRGAVFLPGGGMVMTPN